MFFRKSAPAATRLKPVICKICGCDAAYFDSVDFSQNCSRVSIPPAGVQTPYHRCANCGFLFSTLCDQWTQAEFEQKIYNDDYIKFDPEFASKRPLDQANEFARLIAPHKGIRLLDYGGGGGVFARKMRELGFDAASYDPFHISETAPPESERFELMHCREVLEHAIDPHDFVAGMARRLADEAVVYLSTVTQPPDIAAQRLNWWYAGPRNGHFSLFTYQSLDMLWSDHGFEFGSFNSFLHLAWRGRPACLPSLLESGRLYRAHELGPWT